MKTTLSIVLAAVIFLSACGSNQVLTSLQVVVVAAEAAVASLEATGNLDPVTANRIGNYLAVVSQETSFAAQELASTDAANIKVAKIVQAFAAATVPVLPAGTPQAIAAAVDAVAKAVVQFLATIQTPVPPKGITVYDSDKSQLESMKVRAEGVRSRAMRLRK